VTPGTWLHSAAAAAGGDATSWIMAWCAAATAGGLLLLWLGRLTARAVKRALHMRERFKTAGATSSRPPGLA
jgi:uncharacterized membrane protein YdjX (TVP38/TMEM64 family)